MTRRSLILIACLLFTPLLGEAAARVFAALSGENQPVQLSGGDFGEYDEQLGYRPRPGASVRATAPEYEVEYAINERGLRQQQIISYERVPGKKRILIAGDSFSFGHGVSEPDRYSDRLEAELANTEIVNMGVNGWGTDQQLLGYLAEGVRYEADVVILAFVTTLIQRNATGEFLKLDGRLAAKPKYELRGEELVLTNVPVPKPRERRGGEGAGDLDADADVHATGVPIPFRNFLRDNSVLYKLARSRLRTALREILQSHPNPLPEYAETRDEWRLTRAILLEFDRRVRENGSAFLLAITPPKDFVELGYVKDTPHRMLVALGAEAGFPVVDLRPPLRAAHERGGDRIYFRHDAHLTPVGHRVVANALVEELDRSFDFESKAGLER